MVRGVFASTVLLTLVVACTGSPETKPTGGPRPGGVYRTAVPDFGLTDGLDPTGEYSSIGWEVLTGVVRTLLTFRHVGGEAGNVPVPDLAASMPTVSDDGLTYSFTLKPDIRFGPPLNRPITSHDVEYAFERLHHPGAHRFILRYVGTLTYTKKDDRYTYSWATSKSWAGTCRQLIVKLKDGTSHPADFRLTK